MSVVNAGKLVVVRHSEAGARASLQNEGRRGAFGGSGGCLANEGGWQDFGLATFSTLRICESLRMWLKWYD